MRKTLAKRSEVHDDCQAIFNTDSGIFHSWLSFKYRPLPLLTFNFKVSRSSAYPTTTIINGINVEGQNVDNPFVHKQQFNFTL